VYQAGIVFIVVAYLVGSIPFSHLIAHWRTGLDLRNVGEGNVGSRNVWHVVGPAWGVLAGALDLMKGFAVYVLGAALGMPEIVIILAGVAVLLGHQFPIFLRGRGGKGLATAGGFMFGLSPLSMTGSAIVLSLAFAITHDFNLSLIPGVIATIVLPLVFRQPVWVAGVALLLASLAGIKKALDREHEAQVWATQPWEGTATPGFHRHDDGSQA
jgi:glycerol-3-phosphate acyltransferase PlsY